MRRVGLVGGRVSGGCGRCVHRNLLGRPARGRQRSWRGSSRPGASTVRSDTSSCSRVNHADRVMRSSGGASRTRLSVAGVGAEPGREFLHGGRIQRGVGRRSGAAGRPSAAATTRRAACRADRRRGRTRTPAGTAAARRTGSARIVVGEGRVAHEQRGSERQQRPTDLSRGGSWLEASSASSARRPSRRRCTRDPSRRCNCGGTTSRSSPRRRSARD